jgi:hypothetical protein
MPLTFSDPMILRVKCFPFGSIPFPAVAVTPDTITAIARKSIKTSFVFIVLLRPGRSPQREISLDTYRILGGVHLNLLNPGYPVPNLGVLRDTFPAETALPDTVSRVSIGCLRESLPMALSPAEEPKPHPDERKKKALLRLVVTLLAIDTLAVIGYLVLVVVLGWEGMVPLGLLILASVFTGFGFQAGKQKIDRM